MSSPACYGSVSTGRQAPDTRPGNSVERRDPRRSRLNAGAQALAFTWSVNAFQVSAAKASRGRPGACCPGRPRPDRRCRPRRRFRRCCRCGCFCATRRGSRRPHGLDVVAVIAGPGNGGVDGDARGRTAWATLGQVSCAMAVLSQPGDASRISCFLADHPRWSISWDKSTAYGGSRKTTPTPTSTPKAATRTP